MFLGRKGNYPIILTDFTCCIFFALILKSRHSRLFLKSRSKTEPESPCSSVIIFLILLLHVIFLSASASCDILDDNNPPQKKIYFSIFFCVFVSSQCTPIVGHGFVLDKYKCHCRRGFYHPSRVALNGYKSRLQIPL